MTQEEKLEEAKRLYETANADQKYVLESLFPELCESEDERIRKAIHIYLDWLDGRNKDYQPKGNYTIKDMIAWLEKQGEIIKEWSEMKINRIQTELQEMVDLKQKTEQGEQNPAWSEEDRQTLHLIIDDLSEELNDEPDEADKEILCRKISFLNSLKPQPIHKWDREDNKVKLEITNYLECQQREEPTRTDILNKWIAWIANLGPQWKQKPAWSEEDEKMVGNIRSIIEKYAFSQSAVDVNGDLCEKEYMDADNWLKSLSPQSQWKPSEGQMQILHWCVPLWVEPKLKAILESLINDLKKLREE